MVAGIVGVGEQVGKTTVQGVTYVKENAAPAASTAMESTRKFAEDVGEKTIPVVKSGFAVCTQKAGEAVESAKKAVDGARGGGGGDSAGGAAGS